VEEGSSVMIHALGRSLLIPLDRKETKSAEEKRHYALVRQIISNWKDPGETSVGVLINTIQCWRFGVLDQINIKIDQIRQLRLHHFTTRHFSSGSTLQSPALEFRQA
jgi:hypothetical protein